jgi:hypothetical protein
MLARIRERLHEGLHKLLGMPPHSEAERLNQNLGVTPGRARPSPGSEKRQRASRRAATGPGGLAGVDRRTVRR